MEKTIEFRNVWKKFKKGERLTSLRDAVPNFFKEITYKTQNNFLNAREFWALKDVNFSIQKGEVVGIIGPNGAGKSTILKLLSRILRPNKGSVNINGRLSALIEVTAGFHPEFTGRENVYFNGAIIGMTKKEIGKKFDSIVDFSGIKEFIDTPVKRYSSGMYARLGFSISAHVDPDILLVDEVLSVGDMAFQAKCAQKMREMLDSGVTIILVSHNLSLVQNLCKRVMLLDKGGISKEGTPEEVIPYYQNIVCKQKEEEMKGRVAFHNDKLKFNEQELVNISSVFLCDGDRGHREDFKVGEPISVRVEFDAKSKIENPVFSIDIIRSDGVLCCSSNTKDNGFLLKEINGKGRIKIDLGNLNLTPGTYLANISIWDKYMVHSYAVRREDFIRISSDKARSHTNAVFLPKIEWKRDEN